MWWLGLLKNLALARLAQTGLGGQIGSHYLGRWGQQKEETPQMLTEGQSIQPRDFAAGDISPPGLLYNQQNLNRLPGRQNWNQPESLMDLLFKMLMNTRR